MDVKKKIADNDILGAISDLLSLAKDTKVKNQLTSLSARFNQNEEKNRMGILFHNDYSVERNRIISALIDIGDRLPNTTSNLVNTINIIHKNHGQKPKGYCIRKGIEIPFNIDKPLCKEAFDVWVQYGDKNYRENYCHFSGEPSNGETCFAYPVLNKNWKRAQEVHEF